MDRKIEWSLHAGYLTLFGLFVIFSSTASEHFLIHSLMLWLTTSTLLVGTRLITQRNIGSKMSLFTLPLLVFLTFGHFLIASFFYAQYLVALTGKTGFTWFQPLFYKEILPFHAFALVMGSLHRINVRSRGFHWSMRVSAALVVLVLIGFFGKYAYDMQYDGSEKIRLMDEEFLTLAEVLEHDAFSGKIVYVDFWFSSCGPCIREFKQLPEVKKALQEEGITFLYLARETSHPNSKQLWKNAIKTYGLEGCHVYMSAALEQNVYERLKIHLNGGNFAYPHYLLVDDGGEIVSYNAPQPSEKESLLKVIREMKEQDEIALENQSFF